MVSSSFLGDLQSSSPARKVIVLSRTGLQAIDGLVATLGLVSLGHDGGDSVTSQPGPVSLQKCALGERTSSTLC
jgi:hypothetical protein